MNYIGWGAFEGCSSLIRITIGDNVDFIDIGVFDGCSKLTEVEFNAKNCTYGNETNQSNEYRGIFKGCTALEKVKMREGIKRIPCYAFSGCSALSDINIPQSVTEIGSYAFSNCESLLKIVIPSGVKILESYTFNGCVSLSEIELSDNLTTIGQSAFENCSALDNVIIPESVITIGKSAFESCKKLSAITIHSGVAKLWNSVFRHCSGLEELEYNALNCICDKFNDIFYGCPISKLTIGDNVEVIPNGIFSGCSELTSVTIPKNVTKIGALAFNDCVNLIEVFFNAENCNRLVDTGDDYAFKGCVSFAKLVIGENVKTIPMNAFKGCDGLTHIIIPSSVEEIGAGAFYGCYNIRFMTSKNVIPPKCGEKAFYNIKTEVCPLYVPKESVSQYQIAYGWRDFWKIEGIDFSGVENKFLDDEGESVEYFNLHRMKEDCLSSGVFIKKQGSLVNKIAM